MKGGLKKFYKALAILLLIGIGLPCWAEYPGVLIIAHGSPSEEWNQPVREIVSQVTLPYPIELGFLEFVEGEGIQDAVDRLEKRGVDTAIVVPLFISSFSNHIEEIKYILGLRQDLPEGSEDLVPIVTTLDIRLTSALDDHPLIVEALCDRARELIESPPNEIIVLAAHGAESEDYLKKWDEGLESICARMKWELGVRDVRYGYIFEDKVPYLPDVVSEAVAEADVIVIPLMISKGFFTKRFIPRILSSFMEDIAYNGRPLAPSKDIAKWIELTASAPLVKLPPISIYDSEQGLLEITLDEVRKPEPMCSCRVNAFRVCQEAFSHLWEDEIPVRDDILIISLHPSHGHEEAFDYITKAASRGDYLVGLPRGTSIKNITEENYIFGVYKKSENRLAILTLKDDVFPKRFLEFRNWIRPKIKDGTATEAQKRAFVSAKMDFIDRILITEEPYKILIFH